MRIINLLGLSTTIRKFATVVCVNHSGGFVLGKSNFVSIITAGSKQFAFSMNIDSDSGNHWRGVPLTELYGSQSPWGAPEFPLVSPSYNHAVLYHVPSSGCVPSDRPPKPQIGHDKWDSEHVRMSCSNHSLYPVNNESTGETHLKRRWEMIENALSKPLRNSYDLADAILSYNTKFRNIWKFKGLHKLFNEYLEEEESQYFLDVTLPEVAKLALALPKLVQAPIPLLKQNKNRSISLSQQQIACLLANAFFCTFPRRNSRKGTSEYSSYPYINFNTYWLYEHTDSDSNLEKLKCICHYFRRVITKVPVGAVTYSRRSVPSRSLPCWARSSRSLAALPLHVDSHNTIEDADGLIQIDFANKFLGGGVLGHGCVQEEIRFVICPELMLSMLFTEELKPNEALIIIGAERYSSYTGYGASFQWAGDFVDKTPRDSSGRRRCAVLAIDAVPYSNVIHEFKKESITRELNKAWVGVSFPPAAGAPGAATGNWGCGAFRGTARLKSVLQLMACAEAGRPVAYYTFGDHQLRDDIVDMYNLLARYNVTVGQLYNHLIKFSENQNDVINCRLHEYLKQVIKGIDPPPSQPVDKMETSIEYVPETILVIEDEANVSSDLFSQDEIDENLIEALEKVEESDQHTDKQTGQQTDKQTDKQTNDKDNKKTDSTHCRQSLFDTIQKMDEEPNTSIASPSQGNQNKNVTEFDPNLSVNNEEKSDHSSELKKKVTKKITDYFSKKSL